MRWGSANVLTLHETVGSAVVREKGLSASARRLDLEAQFNASGYRIVGLQETRCRREGDRKGRHYYMIRTAASDIGQGGCELWINLKLKPGKNSITVTAASRIDYVCAPQDLRSAVSGAGTCEEVLLQTGGRVDHLLVFADVSVQPLQGKKNVQRKKCICNVRMARFDSDAIQRFEAAIAFAPAMPLTFDVDQHAGLLARFVRQTAAQVFPKETARRKKDWISDDTWKLILAKNRF